MPCEVAGPVAAAKGVRLEGRMNGPADLEASAAELARVLHNLLDNAIRETLPGGTICVEAGRQDGRVVIAVTDACGGIPEADLARVFDPAFRGEAARSPSGGSGLGLAIARGLVEAHDGSLSVENHGPGCRFTISLPA
jgi:signal transduction histidine kinase